MSNRFSVVVDLLAVLGLLGVAAGVVSAPVPVGDGPLRAFLVLPAIIFAPGYALVSFLYPELPGGEGARDDEAAGWSLTGLERLGLAVAASLAIVPIVALVSNFTPLGVRARPVLAGVVGLSVVLTLGAFVQRFRVDPDHRFRVPVGTLIVDGVGRYLAPSRSGVRQRSSFEVRSHGQRLLNLLLIGSVLVFAGSVAYAAVGPTLPSQDGDFTELYLLDGDGERLLGSEGPVGDGSVPATVVLENNEGEETTYTVVIQRQQVATGDGETRVQRRTVVDSFGTTLADGGSKRFSRTLQGGSGERVVILVFQGDPPANPTAENAYRMARVWPAGTPDTSGDE
jgi:uncharacterized membrane protein